MRTTQTPAQIASELSREYRPYMADDEQYRHIHEWQENNVPRGFANGVILGVVIWGVIIAAFFAAQWLL